MSLHFSTLALYTGPRPTTNVRVDPRPDKARGDESLSGSDTGVGEFVERFENDTTPGLWNNGAV